MTGFKIKNQIEVQDQLSSKLLGFVIVLWCISGPNWEIHVDMVVIYRMDKFKLGSKFWF